MAKSPNNFSSLRNGEIEFLQENMEHLKFRAKRTLRGIFQRKERRTGRYLREISSDNSMCYVRKDLHSREQDQKRFSKTGKVGCF